MYAYAGWSGTRTLTECEHAHATEEHEGLVVNVLEHDTL